MQRIVKKLFFSLVDFVYPPLCYHCEDAVQDRSHLLCRGCAEHLVLAEASKRCPYCFVSVEGRIVCSSCLSQSPPYQRCSAACESQGPALSLLREFQLRSPHLKTALASLMTMQIVKLKWNLPDVIIPISSVRFQAVRCGFHPNRLLAKQIGKMIERPVRNLRQLRQMGAKEKRVLLVADQFHQERAVETAHLLLDGFPLEINVISFL